MCLAQGPKCSDAGEARNLWPLGLESSTLPLSHCAPRYSSWMPFLTLFFLHFHTTAVLSTEPETISSSGPGSKDHVKAMFWEPTETRMGSRWGAIPKPHAKVFDPQIPPLWHDPGNKMKIPFHIISIFYL